MASESGDQPCRFLTLTGAEWARRRWVNSAEGEEVKIR